MCLKSDKNREMFLFKNWRMLHIFCFETENGEESSVEVNLWTKFEKQRVPGIRLQPTPEQRRFQ